MDFDEINHILDMIVREHELSEFELEREGFKIRIKKGGARPRLGASGAAGDRRTTAMLPFQRLPRRRRLPEAVPAARCSPLRMKSTSRS